jgi:PiT family inorganic phosphate transporter
LRWSLARRIIAAWALTLPCAALVGAISSTIAGQGVLGTLVVGLIAGGIAQRLFLASRRRRSPRTT